GEAIACRVGSLRREPGTGACLPEHARVDHRRGGARPAGSTRKGTMTGGKIRIRMEAYDHLALDASAKEIVDHAKRTNAKVAGPVPLPTRVERYTVLRSIFIDKKSREQ